VRRAEYQISEAVVQFIFSEAVLASMTIQSLRELKRPQSKLACSLSKRSIRTFCATAI
jgi:hypothetical protein